MDTLADLIDRDGFAVVEDVLDPSGMLALADALERARSEETTLHRGDSAYSMRDVLRCVPEVRRLARSRALLDLVESMLGPDAFTVRGLVFDKTPHEANWNVPWHGDLTIAVRQVAMPSAPVPGRSRSVSRRQTAARGAAGMRPSSACTWTAPARTTARSVSCPARNTWPMAVRVPGAARAEASSVRFGVDAHSLYVLSCFTTRRPRPNPGGTGSFTWNTRRHPCLRV